MKRRLVVSAAICEARITDGCENKLWGSQVHTLWITNQENEVRGKTKLKYWKTKIRKNVKRNKEKKSF